MFLKSALLFNNDFNCSNPDWSTGVLHLSSLVLLCQSDILGDDSKPSLHTLLLQPVQRIPDYLLLLQVRHGSRRRSTFESQPNSHVHCSLFYLCLQGLLRQTESDHPDYYLLLVCIQQFRSFTAQYHHLVQHNQELLLHNRKEVKRSEFRPNNHNKEAAVYKQVQTASPYKKKKKILV